MTDRHPIVLVRHGQTEWSHSGQHTGRTDVPLTDVGRRQADQLGEMLAGREFALVLTSPLSRARETMERAGLAEGAQICDDLLEWDYGVYEGRTTADIRKEIPGWSVWDNEMIGGESVDHVGDRVDRVIQRGVEASGPVACFAHGHVLRIMGARWIRQPAGYGQLYHLDTAGLSELGYEHEYRVLARWNDGCATRDTEKG